MNECSIISSAKTIARTAIFSLADEASIPISPKKMWSGGVGISTNQCLGRSITKSCPLSVADSWSPTTFELTVVAKYWNCRPEHYYSHLCSTLFHHCWGHGQSLTLSLVSSQCVVYNRWKGEKRFLGISTYYAQWCGNMI